MRDGEPSPPARMSQDLRPAHLSWPGGPTSAAACGALNASLLIGPEQIGCAPEAPLASSVKPPASELTVP